MPLLTYNIFSLGDAAITIDFGNVINDDINKTVLHLFQQAKNLRHPAIVDVIPAYSSLTVCYDIVALHSENKTAFESMKEIVSDIFSGEQTIEQTEQRKIQIPVCYASQFAPDIKELAQQKNLTVEEVIQLHTSKSYRVYMIGFLPGFPYMGEVDERIAAPRKQQPRTNVIAGSVGIAGKQTGIYPLTSPGGWQIIGRTPIKIFDKDKDDPVLLQPGDEVQFYSITENEFADHQSGNT